MLDITLAAITIALLLYSHFLYKALTRTDALLSHYKKENKLLTDEIEQQQKTFQLISAEIKNQKPVGIFTEEI